MKHRPKAKVRNRDQNSPRMWTASDSKANSDRSPLAVEDLDDADFDSIDLDLDYLNSSASSISVENAGGRYTRAHARSLDQAAVRESKRRRRGILGLPMSLWVTGFIVFAAVGLYWVSNGGDLSTVLKERGLQIGSTDAESTPAASVDANADSAGDIAGAEDSETTTAGNAGGATESEPDSEAPTTDPDVVADAQSEPEEATMSESGETSDSVEEVAIQPAERAGETLSDTTGGGGGDGSGTTDPAGGSDADAHSEKAMAAGETDSAGNDVTVAEISDQQLIEAAAALTASDPEAEKLYQQIIEQQPDNPEAVGGMAVLRESALTELSTLIDQESLSDAKSTIQGIGTSEEHEKIKNIAAQIDNLSEMGDALDAQIEEARQQQIPWWAAQGERRLADGNLILPENQSAVDAYRKLLELEPESALATEGLNQVRDSLVEAATASIDESRWKDARRELEVALEIRQDDETNALLQQISEQEDTSERVEALLAEADEFLQNDKLLGEESALSVLNKAIVLDPDNEEIRQRRTALVPRLLKNANFAASEEQWESAKDQLNLILVLDPENEDAQSMLDQVTKDTELAAARIAEEEKLAEEERLAEEKRAEEEKLAEEERLAEEKRAEDEKLAEEERLAEEKRVEEEKQLDEQRIAEEEQRQKEAQLAEVTAAHCQGDYDCIGMVIDSGDPVLVQMGKEMSQMVTGPGGGTVVKPTEGPIANTMRMLSTENAGLSVVPSDMLSFTDRSDDPSLRRASRRLRFIMTIGQKTVFLLANKSIRSIADLDGKRVVMGPGNTAIWVVSNNLLHLNNVTPSERIEQKPPVGIMTLIAGEADAVFVVGPNPHPLLKNLNKMRTSEKYGEYVTDLHMLPVTIAGTSSEYVADVADYPGLADRVDTVAILPTLVSYDFTHKNSPYFQRRCDELARVGTTVVDRLNELRDSGHKQWKATSWEIQAGPWKKDACFFRDSDKLANLVE